MILKPFMLRRIKKDVENELSDKVEGRLPSLHLLSRASLSELLFKIKDHVVRKD